MATKIGEIYIVTEKNGNNEKNLFVNCYSLEDGTSHYVQIFTREQYDEIQIGYVYIADPEDIQRGRFTQMTDEIINIILSEDYLFSECSAYVYKFLPTKCKSNPILLMKFLKSFNPWQCSTNPHGKEIENPINYAMSEALTDENIKIAIDTGWKISFPYDKNDNACKQKFLNYLCRKLSTTDQNINQLLGISEESSKIIGFTYISCGMLEELQKKLKLVERK